MNKLAVGVIGLLLCAGMVYGAFEDIGQTARAKGMGGAIFADFDGVNTMHYNPATIAEARTIGVYGAWDTPYTGLNDESTINAFNVNFVIPFWRNFTIQPDTIFTKDAALGLSFRRFSVGGLDTTGSSVEFYHEGVYSLFYAKNFNNTLLQGANFSFGTKLSIYDIGVGNSADVSANPDFTQLGKLGFGLDVGATYDFSKAIRLGITYRNLIAPEVSILPDATNYLPSQFALGGNWKIGDLFGFLKKSELGFGMVTYGRDSSDNRQADSSWHIGYEFQQLTAEDLFKNSGFTGEMLAVRVGAVYEAKKVGDTLDLGFAQLKGVFTVSGGTGFRYVIERSHEIKLDYAIEYTIKAGALRHVVGLSYHYLFPERAFIYPDDEYSGREFDDLMKDRQTSETNEATNAASGPATNEGADSTRSGRVWGQ